MSEGEIRNFCGGFSARYRYIEDWVRKCLWLVLGAPEPLRVEGYRPTPKAHRITQLLWNPDPQSFKKLAS